MRTVRRLLVLALLAAPQLAEAEAHPPPTRALAGKQVARAGLLGAARRPAQGLKVKLPARSIDTAPREVGDPADPHEQRIALLRERLESALHEKPLSRSRVGVQVMEVRDGDVLFAHNAQKQFNPASNTKILTTAAALSQLGGDWTYSTALYGPSPDLDGVVHGDVELRGSGDPSLVTPDLADLAARLASRGVTKIEGAILTNGRFRDPEQPDQSVGELALILDRNTYGLRVVPGDLGKPATVEIEPALSDYFVVEGAPTTTAKRTRLAIDARRDASGNKLIVSVRGRVNVRSDVRLRRRLADGALYSAATLRGALEDYGIEVTGGTKAGGLPGDAPLLAEHRSRPLSEICRISNKESNNFVAEAIFRTVGGELYGIPGTLAKGSRAVDDLLAPLGIPRVAYTIVNGSGLTHANRIQPSALSALLRSLYYDLAIAPEFMASLAVGGIDGTIRNRFLGTDAVGLVRAKTGTLSGVSALSGYVGDKDDVLIFSIFVEGFRHRTLTAIRQAQVRMVQAMLAFLRADRPSPGSGEPNQAAPAAVDSESDGDPDSSGGE
jgi:D-alanyl-D-alanine carboxypeptidase/D-alanyl-D-alanine-endopeptidase (penicillin-binding protein 4)